MPEKRLQKTRKNQPEVNTITTSDDNAILVTFECATCLDTNRSMLGINGFIERVWEFTSMTEIFDHLLEYPEHYATAVVKQ